MSFIFELCSEMKLVVCYLLTLTKKFKFSQAQINFYPLPTERGFCSFRLKIRLLDFGLFVDIYITSPHLPPRLGFWRFANFSHSQMRSIWESIIYSIDWVSEQSSKTTFVHSVRKSVIEQTSTNQRNL